MLQNQPHTFHVILGIPPVAQRVQVTQVQLLLLALCDAGRSQRNLTRYESFSAAFRFMIEQDTRAAEHVVRLAVLLHNPVAIQFSHRIRTVRMERRVLVLRHFLHLSVEFRSRSLIDAASILQATQTHRFQHTEHTRSIHVGCKFRRVKAHLYMALCSQVINLCRAHLADYLQDTHRVTQVCIMQVKVRFSFQVRDTFAEVYR